MIGLYVNSEPDAPVELDIPHKVDWKSVLLEPAEYESLDSLSRYLGT